MTENIGDWQSRFAALRESIYEALPQFDAGERFVEEPYSSKYGNATEDSTDQTETSLQEKAAPPVATQNRSTGNYRWGSSNTSNVSYNWSGPNSFASLSQNPVDNAAISGVRIVWTQYTSDGHTVIYLKNLSTGYTGRVA